LLFTTSVFAQNQRLTENQKLERTLNKIVEKHNPKFGEKSVTLILDSTIHSVFNEFDSIWTTFQKAQYSYTSVGLIQESIVGDLFGGLWDPFKKSNYFYSPNNVLTEIVNSRWDFYDGWMNDYKVIYTQNSLGQNTEIINLKWNEYLLIWENDYKEQFSYNSYGNWDTVFRFSWNKTTNNWALGMRTCVNFNSNQTISDAIMQMWLDADWMNVYRFEWAYDANDYLISETSFINNNPPFPNLPYFRSLYTNNASGHVLIKEDQVWEEDTWLSGYKVENTLDSNNYIQLEFSYWFETSSMDWEIDEKIEYFYTNVTSVNDFAYNSSVIAYPNPVSDILIINSNDEISNLRIFNINGQLVKSFNPASKETTIDVSSFANGVYFVHVLSHKKNTVQRVIIQH